MKIAIAIIMLFYACGTVQEKPFVQGTYVASFEHEFGKVEDTLVLQESKDGEGVYLMEKRSGIQRKLDGKVFPKEQQNISYILEHDSKKQLLRDMRSGKLFRWDGSQHALVLGNRIYHPLNK